MCTSLLLHSINKSIFGRNLDIDLEIDNKNIIISSRNSKLIFKNGEYINSHYAFMGIGILVNNYPLYFDGTNEFSLSVASLNFPVFGVLNNPLKSRLNLASYEIIPYILSKFKSVDEVKDNLKKLNITNIDFICGLKSVSLHYFVCDKTKSIVIEQTKDGVTIYDNPYHILTNSPTFAYHLQNIAQYLNISNNYIHKIDKNIHKLIKLKELDISSCNINYLPKEIFYLYNLRFIDISFNKIKKISKDIQNLQKLEEITINSNQIKSIPKEIEKLNTIKKI